MNFIKKLLLCLLFLLSFSGCSHNNKENVASQLPSDGINNTKVNDSNLDYDFTSTVHLL